MAGATPLCEDDVGALEFLLDRGVLAERAARDVATVARCMEQTLSAALLHLATAKLSGDTLEDELTIRHTDIQLTANCCEREPTN